MPELSIGCLYRQVPTENLILRRSVPVMPLVDVGPQATDRCNPEALMLDSHAKHVIQSRAALFNVLTLFRVLTVLFERR